MSGQNILTGSKLCWEAIFRQGTICPDAILRPDEIFSMDENGSDCLGQVAFSYRFNHNIYTYTNAHRHSQLPMRDMIITWHTERTAHKPGDENGYENEQRLLKYRQFRRTSTKKHVNTIFYHPKSYLLTQG